jgi:hypothetical protein
MKKNLSFVMAVGWVFSLSLAGLAEAQDNMQIATWAGFRSAAAVFTFDDGCANQLSIAVPIFDKYDYKASFYLVTGWSPNYNAYQALVDKGYEVGSHSDNHASNAADGRTMPDSEIASSKSNINSHISGQTCNTITYPNCEEPNETTLKANYIGGRICANGIDGATPNNYYRINSVICGNTGSVNSAEAFQGKMQQAINQGGWVTFLIHEVDNGNGYSPTSSQAIDGALDWAKKNDSKIWVTTFRNAIMYSKERDKSTIAKKSGDASSETYTLTHSIKDNVSNYDYPLSIRIKNSNNWTTVSGTQGGKAITVTINGDYIYFDAVPNGGDIVISSGGGSTNPTSSSATQPTSSNSSIGVSVEYKIEMEDYMQGGEGVGYSDIDGKNDTTGYRPDDAGIVKVGTDGYGVGYTMAGEWFSYSLDVTCQGQYSVVARAATGNSSITRFSVSAENVSGSVAVDVPSTGSWNTYTEVEGSGTLNLSPGKNVIKVNIDQSYVNVDWIKLTSDNAQCPEVIPVAKNLRLNSLSGPVQYQVFDMNGHLIKSATVSAQGGVKNLWSTASRGLSKGTYVLRYGNGSSTRSVQVRK